MAVGNRGESRILTTSEPLNEKMKSYTDALKGFPGRSRGSYGRMLYLSASTITTLGFGDIVPLTSQARLWVGIEAVLGVILIGLFLTSLSFEVGNRARTKDTDKPTVLKERGSYDGPEHI
jgi:hypothetical protein